MKNIEVRSAYLDGVRGVAALVVVLSHMEAFVAVMASGSGLYEQQSLAFKVFNRLANGNFAVCIFFVLSGIVLLSGFKKGLDRRYLAEGAVKRYFRLTPVAAASILFACALIHTIGYHGPQVAAAIGGHEWLSSSTPASAGFAKAVYQGLIGVYRKDYDLNGVLWTICIELYGTIFLFMFVGLFFNPKHYYAVVGVASAWLVWAAGGDGLYVALFLGGSLLTLDRRFTGRWFLIVPAIYFGTYTPLVHEMSFWNGLLDRLGVQPGFDVSLIFRGVAALLLISAVNGSHFLQKLFEARPVLWMGRVSFCFYAFHLPVLKSLGCLSFVWITPLFGTRVAAAVAVAVTLVVSAVMADLAYRLFDVPSQRLSAKVGRLWTRGAADRNVEADKLQGAPLAGGDGGNAVGPGSHVCRI